MRKYLILIVAFIALISTCTVLYDCWQKERKENKRLSSNQTALLTDVVFYKTEAGESAAKVQRLELTKDEFEKQCVTLKEEVEALGIKTKRLQSLINTTTKTEAKITAQVKDSIVYRNKEQPPDTLRCIEFKDNYMQVNGCIDKDTFNGNIVSYDSLLFVAHRVPKKFWFIKWGTKAIELDVVSKNPHTQITYSRYIEFKK